MPANPVSINLLGKDSFASSPYGRIVTWAITYGRYIMIGTEVVVLLAFISRFSLDRKLTDLKEEISQKRAIVEINLPLETEVKNLQNQLTNIKTLLKTQTKPVELFFRIQSFIPADVRLETFDINGDTISVSAAAGTNTGLGQFFAALQADSNISDIEIGDVSRDLATGIQFKFTARITGIKIKEK